MSNQPKMGMQKAWAGLSVPLASYIVAKLGSDAIGLEGPIAMLIENGVPAILTMAAVYFIPNKVKGE